MTDQHLNAITHKQYNYALGSIYRIYEDEYHTKFVNPQTFSTDSEKIMTYLYKTYKKGTIINFISAILWHMNNIESTHDPVLIERIRTIYREYGTKIKADIDREKIGKEFELTEKEQKSFMIWEDILQIYEKMTNELDRSNYSQMLDYVIISLYVLHPPVRADYANMRLFIDDEHIPDGYEDNYCVIQPNPRFVFQKYKNAKHRGVTIIPIEPELYSILLDWIYELNPSDWLLPTRLVSSHTFKPMSENALVKRIPEIFIRHGGKPVTVNTLRHSFVSFLSKHDQEYNRKLANADKMMHSVDMATKYRRMVYLQ